VNSLLDKQRPSLFWRALRVVGIGVLGASVITIAGLVTHQLLEAEELHVYTVDIQGNERVSTVHLRHLTDVRSGQHLATVDVAHVAQSIQRHPWIEGVTVRMEFPSTIRISVTEHSPVMLLALENLWYVDQDGQPFHRAHSADLDYPILTGLDETLVSMHPDLSSAVIGRALRLLDASMAPPLYGSDRISEVRFHSRTGFTLVLRSGTELMLGFSDPRARLARLEQMTQQGLDLNLPQRIDLNASTFAIATPMATM
jgi:cell division protein FtsQ